MFKSSTSYVLGAMTLLVCAAVTSAVPTQLEARHEDASPNVLVCSGAVNPPSGCVTIPVTSDNCINLTGGLSFLNKEISSAQIQDGLGRPALVMGTGNPRANFCRPAPVPAKTRTHGHGCGFAGDPWVQKPVRV
ncbi:hypothetical protein BDZ97DRAFT_2063368 [Flammula alnicola]|nr:hypothetical protein BDZ97DRAFT_2063368 [Flammula alnicola]